MIEVTDLFMEMAQKYYRNVDFKIVSNDDESTVYSGDVILECQINRSVGSSGIQIGNAISDRLQFTLKSTDKIKSGTRLTPYVRYTGEENTEWLRLGRFYCTESKMSNGIMAVTAYDKLYNFDKRCAFGGKGDIQALSFPATHQQMWDYVCALRGVSTEFQCADFTVAERPLANPNANDDSKFYTQRQIIGMIAACNAGNAVIDNNGKLTVRRFKNQTYKLNKNRCFTQEIDTAEQFQVKGILFHVDSENDIFIDDSEGDYSEDLDGIIVCDNALATVGVAEYVWNKLGNLTYSNCEITRRGVGWLETGETLQVEDFYDADGGTVNVITSEIDYNFSYDNGFTETIRSVAETAEQSGNRAVSSGSGGSGSSVTPSVEMFSKFVANSDGTYTFNGVTYGFELDEATGYINKVYDDCENYVEIDTSNAGVNNGKVDFNTLVLAGAIFHKILSEYGANDTVVTITTTQNNALVVLANAFFPAAGYTGKVDWGDGTVEEINDSSPPHTYANAGTYKIIVEMNPEGTVTLMGYLAGFGFEFGDFIKMADNITELSVTPGKWKTFKLNKNITEINVAFFSNNDALKSVSGYEQITTLGSSAFGGTTNLVQDMVFPNLETISDSTFSKSGITSFAAPKLTSGIYNSTFYECSNLEIIDVPMLQNLNCGVQYANNLKVAHVEGLTIINSSDFPNKTNLTIYVSTTLQKISYSAFQNSIVTIEYSGTQEQWDSIEKVVNWDNGANITLHCNG